MSPPSLRRRAVLLLAVWALLSPPGLPAAEPAPALPAPPAAVELPVPAPPPPAAANTLDEVLVTGERPGPGLWRISNGAHELWILATLEPLPKGMIWRSAAVDARIAAAQSVLAPPRVTTDIGFLRGLTLVPALLRARRSPDGETLEQAVPHDLYIRWLALRVKYLGSGGDEKMRPLVAALDLYMHALERAGLVADDAVWTVVEQTARKHHVPVEPVTLKIPIKDPKATLRGFDAIPRAAEIDCLAKTIERLETDLEPMRERANRWSLGDIDGLRALPYPDEQLACFDAVLSVPALHAEFEHAERDLADTWLAAADASLDSHPSTFAVLSLGTLLKPDGALARLRARGYAVTEPH